MADSGKSRRRVTAANANKKQKKKKGTSGGEQLDKMVNDLYSRYLDIRWQEILLLSALDICCIHLLLSVDISIYVSVDTYY